MHFVLAALIECANELKPGAAVGSTHSKDHQRTSHGRCGTFSFLYESWNKSFVYIIGGQDRNASSNLVKKASITTLVSEPHVGHPCLVTAIINRVTTWTLISPQMALQGVTGGSDRAPCSVWALGLSRFLFSVVHASKVTNDCWVSLA